ncbi:MAG: hypothetical protein AAGJ29_01165 [Pseudomonadota bacterium]
MRQRGKIGELGFGAAIASTILVLSCVAAFNGGVSLKTGELEMTLQGSLAKGLELRFAQAKT